MLHMKTKTPPTTDTRPRFGWCDDLDLEPQRVRESRRGKDDISVVVIPLPFHSTKLRKKIKEFAKSLWQKEDV